MKILVLNPGSTSTKVAVYEGDVCIEDEKMVYDNSMLERPLFPDQYQQRKIDILSFVSRHSYDLSSFGAIAARGGRLKPIPSGVYKVNEEMVTHAKVGLQGQHPANMAVVIAHDLSKKYSIPAYIVDPISVDEFDEHVRITGLNGISKASLSHALNMKAVAKMAASDLGLPYNECHLIVVHLGGGGSVSAHRMGRMVDLYNSDQEGPFAVERAGGLPSLKLLEYLNANKVGYTEGPALLAHEGGLYSYFKTRDFHEIEALCEKDPQAELILEAYVYSIAKAVASFLPVFKGEIHAICFSGGVINSIHMQERLNKWLGYIGKLLWYPGEMEMDTLARRVHDVLRGEEEACDY